MNFCKIIYIIKQKFIIYWEVAVDKDIRIQEKSSNSKNSDLKKK